MNTSRWLVFAVQLLITVTVVNTRTGSKSKCILEGVCVRLILKQCRYSKGICESKIQRRLEEQMKQDDATGEDIFLEKLQLSFDCSEAHSDQRIANETLVHGIGITKVINREVKILFIPLSLTSEKYIIFTRTIDGTSWKTQCQSQGGTDMKFWENLDLPDSLCPCLGGAKEARTSVVANECVITGSHVAIAAIASFVGGAFVMLLFLQLLRRRSSASLSTCVSMTTEQNETVRLENTEGFSNQETMDGSASIAVSHPGYDGRKLYSHLRQGERDSEHEFDQSEPAYETISMTANRSRVSSEEHVYNAANSYQKLKDQEALSNGQENGEHEYTGLKGQSEIQTTGVSGPRSESVNHLQDKIGNVFENRESVASEHNGFTLQTDNFRLSEPRETAATSDSQNGPHSYLQNENSARAGSGDKRENTEEVQQKVDPHPYFTLQKVDAAGPGNNEKGEKNEEAQKGGEAAHDYFVLEKSMSGDKKNDAHGQL